MTDGNDIRRRVCPVGAVSKTTTEKSILRTNLKEGGKIKEDKVSLTAYAL